MNVQPLSVFTPVQSTGREVGYGEEGIGASSAARMFAPGLTAGISCGLTCS